MNFLWFYVVLCMYLDNLVVFMYILIGVNVYIINNNSYFIYFI